MPNRGRCLIQAGSWADAPVVLFVPRASAGGVPVNLEASRRRCVSVQPSGAEGFHYTGVNHG